MARPNKPRDIHAERHVAQRVKLEREQRGWSPASLAKRMTDAGCPIQQSAIYKIEAGQRKVSVDELVALRMVFNVPLSSWVSDPAGLIPSRLADLAERVVLKQIETEALYQQADAADYELRELRDQLREQIEAHADTAGDVLARLEASIRQDELDDMGRVFLDELRSDINHTARMHALRAEGDRLARQQHEEEGA